MASSNDRWSSVDSSNLFAGIVVIHGRYRVERLVETSSTSTWEPFHYSKNRFLILATSKLGHCGWSSFFLQSLQGGPSTLLVLSEELDSIFDWSCHTVSEDVDKLQGARSLLLLRRKLTIHFGPGDVEHVYTSRHNLPHHKLLEAWLREVNKWSNDLGQASLWK